MELIAITLGLVIIAVLLLAFNIIFRKKTFPNTHVGQNKGLKQKGISCANSYDKIERNKVKEELRLKQLSFIKEF